MYLVIGATGTVGSEVVRLLAGSGAQVRALSRNPAEATVPDGVEAVTGDLGDVDSLVRAMRGATGVFSLMRPGPPDNLASAAHTAGVAHVVLLTSAMAEPDGPDNPLAEAHRQAETALINAGIPATFLRPTAFASNTLGWSESIRTENTVRAPFGRLRLAMIDPRDVAAVAAAALTSDGHADNAYLLSGPSVLSITEQVEVLAEALGRAITFTELTEAEAHAHLLQTVPPMVADAMLAGQKAALDATPAVSLAVETVLNRAPRSYREWVNDHVAAFR